MYMHQRRNYIISLFSNKSLSVCQTPIDQELSASGEQPGQWGLARRGRADRLRMLRPAPGLSPGVLARRPRYLDLTVYPVPFN